MAGLGNNLYPPIFKKAYVPAFVKSGDNSGCRIYFSLSNYNSLDEMLIDYVQVSIQYQNTNYSAVNTVVTETDKDGYPAGIINTSIKEDPYRITDDKYYIQLNITQFQNKEIKAGQYYKVQIRFTSASIQDKPIGKPDQSWYTKNLAYFSQWSQVVLIKGISQPRLELKSFTEGATEQTFTLQDIYLVGSVHFDTEDNEYLKKYRILLYNDSNQLIQDSKEKYSNIYTNPNEVYYKIKYNLRNDNKYRLVIQLQSNNLYEWEVQYNFNMELVQYTTLDSNIFKIRAQADNSGGRIKVYVTSTQYPSQIGMNLIIRRSSSKENFDYWEDMYTFLASPGHNINEIWYDRTIESGVWYKYSLQQRNLQGFRSNFIEYQTPIMCVFEDIFLTAGDKQLKIRFNPQVNNYSHVVAESLTQTIGSKYPFIRRNGNVDYRTFSLSGTISHFMDARQNTMQASSTDLYGNIKINESDSVKSKRDEYNQRHRINIYNDSVYEKDFRQKVIEFLYNNDVKLYKSTTQGNILVKLMNISFTPNNTLSRHIYDFTCTAQEVDQFTIENCDKYNIQSRGNYSNQTFISFVSQGQVIMPDFNLYYQTGNIENGVTKIPEIPYNNRQIYDKESNLTFGGEYDNNTSSGDIIKNYITPKYHYLKTDLINVKVDYLSYLKIEFTSPPYLISKNDKVGLKICEDSETPLYLGHLIKINRQTIIVSPEGIYELTDNITQIRTLSFISSQETGVINYEAAVVEFEQSSLIPKTYKNIEKIGQFFGFFRTFESIYKKIYSKYYYASYKTETSENGEDLKLNASQQLNRVKGVRIYAAPNTIIRVKEQQDGQNISESMYDSFVIGPTGLLEFYSQDEEDGDKGTNIKGMYIEGIKLTKTNVNTSQISDNEYYKFEDPNIQYHSIEEIENPKKNYVYTITGTESLNILKSQLFSTAEENIRGIVLEENKQIAAINNETAVLEGSALNNVNTCIYYHGGWYLFIQDASGTSGMVTGIPVQIMIDFYCDILRKEYGL